MSALSSTYSMLNIFLNIVLPPDCPLTWSHDYPDGSHSQERYDFIIIGAGTAGCTLANRLSENRKWNVALIESGAVPSNLSQIPAMFLSLQKTSEDWGFVTQPAKTFAAYKKSVSSWPQGHTLGGGSGINGMLCSKGVPYDYDHWEKEMGCKGWGWKDVKGYFKKMKKSSSSEGYVETTLYKSAMPTRNMLIRAAQRLGIPVNRGGRFGFRDVCTTIKDGKRFSMAKAYLTPIKHRPNLCVMTGTQARKILVSGTRAFGVEVRLPDGHITKMLAGKEVLVTAGAINSPKLLLISGIGPKNELLSLGIQPVVDLPKVGRNLQDHVIIPMHVELNLSIPQRSKMLEAYCKQPGGPLGQVDITNFQGFFNTLNEMDRPNIELFSLTYPVANKVLFDTYLQTFGYKQEFAEKLRKAHQRTGVLLFLPTLLHEKSRGSVRLRDTNPDSYPIITANYFKETDDLKEMVQGMRIVRDLVSTSPFATSSFTNLEVESCAEFTFNSMQYWRCYAQSFATTVYHPAGTCRMGNSSTNSVVNHRLKVWGMKGLRVIGASNMPELISGHSNIPVCMMAEKASDMIKEDYL